MDEPVIREILRKIDAKRAENAAIGGSPAETFPANPDRGKGFAHTTTNNVCLEESLKDSSKQTNEQPPCAGGPVKGPPPMADERRTASGDHAVIRRAAEIYAAIGDDTLVRWAAITLAVHEADGKGEQVAAAIAAAQRSCCFDSPRRRFRDAKLEWWSVARCKAVLAKRFGIAWRADWANNRDPNGAERTRGPKRSRSPPP